METITFTAHTLGEARAAATEWALSNGSAQVVRIATSRDGAERRVTIVYREREE